MIRSLLLAFFLITSLSTQQPAPRCNDIVGHWKWFVGPELIISADHSFSNSENSGTWKLTDAKERKYTLTWDVGGFVDNVMLSDDGRKLTGTNNQENKVSGERIGECSSQ